jgi:hypothetical protein
MAQIYPLPMRFPVPTTGGGGYIDVTITPDGWSFITQGDRQTFEGQAVADRLAYRRAFEMQVELAKDTPTKGER